ncbi:flagellar export protein FliJ [Paenibacillus sp. y28]|uniref:flagellar export protein FliJ n=1 Tax=Paenibacillus sp. y28 TaxID=3129110 RepID=UPI0030179FF1
MKFKYSFQKLVDLKANEKSQAEWMLSKAIGKLNEEESSLQGLQAEKTSTHERMLGTAERKATISEMIAAQHYMQHLDHRIQQKRQEVHRAQNEVSQKQVFLSEKMLQEKVWNKAKERAYESFVGKIRKQEQEELDEIATVRHSHIM